MLALKIIFLILLAFPFALFLVFIINKLMEEIPQGRNSSREKHINGEKKASQDKSTDKDRRKTAAKRRKNRVKRRKKL